MHRAKPWLNQSTMGQKNRDVNEWVGWCVGIGVFSDRIIYFVFVFWLMKYYVIPYGYHIIHISHPSWENFTFATTQEAESIYIQTPWQQIISHVCVEKIPSTINNSPPLGCNRLYN